MNLDVESFALSVRSDARDKPNEDVYVANDARQIYIVADGVTSPRRGGSYPAQAGGLQAATVFCEVLCSSLYRLDQRTVAKTRAAIANANIAVGCLNDARTRDETIDYLHTDYWGTVATVMLGVDDGFVVHHLGDAVGAVMRGGRLRSFTRNQTAAVSLYQRQVRAAGAVAPDDLAVAVRRDYRNQISARGQQGEAVAYGVFTGDPAAVDFVDSLTIKAMSGDIVILATDGLRPFLDRAMGYQKEGQHLAKMVSTWPPGREEIMEAARAHEDRSDDKTIIVLRVR